MIKSNWICIVVFMLVLQILFLWSIDISVSALINYGVVTNGFMTNNPMITYHIALYGAILTSVAFSFISIHFITKEKEK